MRVERARVVPQPQGALMYYGHVHNRVAEIRKERSLIIDPGARTFDRLVTQGMQLVEKKSHSVNRGMFDVLQAIASGISKATGILDGLIRAVAIDSITRPRQVRSWRVAWEWVAILVSYIRPKIRFWTHGTD